MLRKITKEDFRYFNNETMAVYRCDDFVYSLFREKDKWYCNISLCYNSGIINNFSLGDGKDSFEESLEDCRKKALQQLKMLKDNV